MRVRAGAEDGYTMVAAIGATTLISVLAAAALAASNGDLGLVQRDLDYKRAHAAAQAGIADYSFHLNKDNSYWARCTDVPGQGEAGKSAVNQERKEPEEEPAERRPVPGSKDAEYAIELLPANGEDECDPSDPLGTMLEQSGSNAGSFRIRATGYAGTAKASLVATYKRASLLDYVYFTQLETSDPVTYSDKDTIEHAYEQCVKFRREGRESVNLDDYGAPCEMIVFPTADHIKGPMHTNDDFAICGSPKLGREGGSDVIEVSAPPVGWLDGKCSGFGTANPQFLGPFVTTAPVLKPPVTNGRLKDIAEESNSVYSCQTKIVLKESIMDVTTRNATATVPIPESGVVYVANGSCPNNGSEPWPSCSSAYSPFTATYPSGSDCGNVRLSASGPYTGQLTIAAENDIIIESSLTRSGQGLLGLIANNFVRIKHPFCRDLPWWEEDDVLPEGCPNGWGPAQTGKGKCNSGSNATGTLTNPTIEAAILAIDHSFIVDHYDCGNSLGMLTVKGAISQKYRGAVGLVSGRGYVKNYEYDDRLRYMEPPHFLDPVEPAWHIQRETLDFPWVEE